MHQRDNSATEYAVEIGDTVEFTRPDPWCPGATRTLEGQVTAIRVRAKELRIRYEDPEDTTREGDPEVRSATVPLADCSLLRRDG